MGAPLELADSEKNTFPRGPSNFTKMAKKGPKTRKLSPWVRFVKDNTKAAQAVAEKNGKGERHFATLASWWKEVSDEVKDNYKTDPEFSHQWQVAKKGKKADAKD